MVLFLMNFCVLLLWLRLKNLYNRLYSTTFLNFLLFNSLILNVWAFLSLIFLFFSLSQKGFNVFYIFFIIDTWDSVLIFIRNAFFFLKWAFLMFKNIFLQLFQIKLIILFLNNMSFFILINLASLWINLIFLFFRLFLFFALIIFKIPYFYKLMALLTKLGIITFISCNFFHSRTLDIIRSIIVIYFYFIKISWCFLFIYWILWYYEFSWICNSFWLNFILYAPIIVVWF
jgi:hypothetical protein